VVSILDVETQAVKDVFFASMIWGISWSADDSRLAVIADTDAPGQHTLNLIDLPSGNVSKLVSGSVSLGGARYNLSDYAPVAWSGDGTKLIYSLRTTAWRSNNADRPLGTTITFPY
jgi:Tol biopolymer transport system component